MNAPTDAARFDPKAFLNPAFVNVRSPEDALRVVRQSLREGIGFVFFTMNLDHLVKLKRSAVFREVYARARFVSADGWPVVLMARTREALLRRTTGADLVLPMCGMAAAEGWPVFLFGSTDRALAEAARRLVDRFPDLKIAGRLSPPLGFDPHGEEVASAARAVAASGARICFVALGAPAQEIFCVAAQNVCSGVGFFGVGAALDFIAGFQSRAPLLLQKLHLEWLWRWALSPRRLTRRYIDCLTLLMGLLVTRMMACFQDMIRALARHAAHR